MKTTTEFQLVSTDKLIPYVNNARTHSPEQIMKLRSSLREFGFVNPVIVDKDFNVLAGHGRLLAAKAENITEVPCVFADHLTEAQKKAYILADNRMALDAGWDDELLAVEMQELQDLGFDLSMTGFSEDELAELFATDAEGEEDD
ncbi:MAG: ParB N-terminal domain-containing protein, partial [Succinivibrionaceae bacterium]|nr:ParB N-terminal domain-containing protein [Succinivibrionaceae bacterium]